MQVNIYSIAYPTRALGPGKRLALWVAGCTRNCQGCITPRLQDPAAGVRVDTAQLARRMLAIRLPIQGLTVTGGEPFEQADAVAELLGQVKRGRPSWSVIVYSGYRLEEITRTGNKGQRFLSRVDILVDGPYLARSPSADGIRGSTNQRVHYLGDDPSTLSSLMASWHDGTRELGLGAGNHRMLIGVPATAPRRGEVACEGEKAWSNS